MRGTDYLALRHSLRRIVLECNQACMAIDGILAEQDRVAKVSRWPDVKSVADPQSEGAPLSPHICYEACDDLEGTEP